VEFGGVWWPRHCKDSCSDSRPLDSIDGFVVTSHSLSCHRPAASDDLISTPPNNSKGPNRSRLSHPFARHTTARRGPPRRLQTAQLQNCALFQLHSIPYCISAYGHLTLYRTALLVNTSSIANASFPSDSSQPGGAQRRDEVEISRRSLSLTGLPPLSRALTLPTSTHPASRAVAADL
jgi:hypothetical protein